MAQEKMKTDRQSTENENERVRIPMQTKFYLWFSNVTAQGARMDGLMLKLKAETLA